MKRKVNRVGKNTLTLSLPIKWARRYDISPKDELEVLESGSELVVTAKRKKTDKELTINLTKENLHRRFLITPYINGYDSIRVNYDSHQTLSFIQNNMDLLFGFEIVEQTPDSCKLKNVVDIKPEEFESVLSRLFNICISMFDDLLLYLKNRDEEALKRIILLERVMNRLDVFCRRAINTGAIPTEMNKLGSLYTTVRIVEQIGDLLSSIAINYNKWDVEELKYFIKPVTHLKEAFLILKKIKYSGDEKGFNEYLVLEEQIKNMLTLKQYQSLKSIELCFLLSQGHYKIHDLSEEVISWISLK